MLNVFSNEKELHVQLSDGRCMLLEELVKDYERLLKEESSKKESSKKANPSKPKEEEANTSKTQDDEVITQRLEVGKWFVIDRDVIDKNKEEIRRVCNEAGDEGKKYLKRFEESNRIADWESWWYTRIIKTYICEPFWEYITVQEMRDICERIGDGQCDEVICDLELQMRICNGESADDLFRKADKLPRVRIIRLRNGETGYFGGGTERFAAYPPDLPPADLSSVMFVPDQIDYSHMPYLFRRY